MAKQRFDWNEVVRLHPSGCFQMRDYIKEVYVQGPVNNLSIDDNGIVTIELEWVAKTSLQGFAGFGHWTKASDEEKLRSFPNFSVPFRVKNVPGNGLRIEFGWSVIYINWKGELNPLQVRGLELQSA